MTQELLNRHKDLPTAIFAANDNVATGVLTTLSMNGIKVPSQISLVGFNNLASVKFLNPPLTTVNIPIDYISEVAVSTLQKNIDRTVQNTLSMYVSTQLKIRKSCAEPRTNS